MTRFGPYEILQEIGRGGMGAVYEARVPGEERRLALKVLQEATPELRQRFEREARILSFLGRYPNFMGLHDFGEEGGRPYIVMDLVPGGTLADVMDDTERALDVLAAVARALHFAHEAGVVHRDLKPRNILLDEQGNPVITDFGIAKDLQAETLTRTGTRLGTLHYMAPEQVESRRGTVDRRADVHALGAMLYHILTGSPPYTGSDVVLLKKILMDPVPSSRAANHAVSPALERVCARAMAKDPEDRYRTAGAFAEDLARARTGRPLADDPGGVSRGWVAATVGGAVVLLALGGWVGLLHSRNQDLSAEVERLSSSKEGLPQDASEPKASESRPAEWLAPPASLEREPRELTRGDLAREFMKRAMTLVAENRPQGAARAVLLAAERHFDTVLLRAHEAVPILLEGASEALSQALNLREQEAQGGYVESVVLAREELLLARVLAPTWDMTGTLEILDQVAHSPVPALRHAARPWYHELLDQETVDAVFRNPTDPDLALNSVRMHGNFPLEWQKLMHTAKWAAHEGDLMEEWVLWRPEVTLVWSKLGTTRFLAHRDLMGIRMLEQVARLTGKAFFTYSAGIYHLGAGRLEDAEAWLRQAIAMGKDEEGGGGVTDLAKARLMQVLLLRGGDERIVEAKALAGALSKTGGANNLASYWLSNALLIDRANLRGSEALKPVHLENAWRCEQ